MRALLTASGWGARSASWMRAVARRKRVESDMELEHADHLERLTSDLMAAGHNPQEAARKARIAMGPALKHKEEMRSSLGLRWMDETGSDVRFALRQMRRNPRLAIIGALSLALAIGANSTLFAVVRQLLYTRLGGSSALDRSMQQRPARVGVRLQFESSSRPSPGRLTTPERLLHSFFQREW